MGKWLHCDFTISSEQGVMYWWPLLFHLLSRHSFHFSDPGLENEMSHYLYIRSPLLQKELLSFPDYATGTFQALWDEIYRGTPDVIATFWSDDVYSIDIQVRKHEDQNTVITSFILARAAISDLPVSEIKKRLQRFFSLAQEMYTLCQLCTGRMYWQNGSDIPVAFLGVSFNSSNVSLAREQLNEEVAQIVSIDEHIHLVDPFPVPDKDGTWTYVSLLS